MINRPAYTRTRPIVKSVFTEAVTIRQINPIPDTRNKYGETVPPDINEVETVCSSNPISADDERLGDLQKSGVRLTGLREFFTTQPMNVELKDEFRWKGKDYVSVQTADWGYFQATIAALKEEQ